MSGDERCLACGSPTCLRAECTDGEFDYLVLPCGCTSVSGQGHLPPRGGHCARPTPQTAETPEIGAGR